MVIVCLQIHYALHAGTMYLNMLGTKGCSDITERFEIQHVAVGLPQVSWITFHLMHSKISISATSQMIEHR